MKSNKNKLFCASNVSIVIPIYNRSHVLERAIQSCLESGSEPREIIIVDDSSSPEEKARSQKIVDRYSLAIFLENSNAKGAQGARNTGAKAAQGRWISFLDSDDYLLPGSIEKRLDAARRTGAKVVHSECTIIRDRDFQPFGIPPMQGMIYNELLKRPAPMFQGMLVHKDALEKIDYLDESITSYQEWDSSIRLAKYFEFAFVSESTFVYDCRGVDTISKDMIRDLKGYKQVVLKHRKAILQHCGRDTMAYHYKQIAYRYKAIGLQSEYLKYFAKSMLLQPSEGISLLKRFTSKAIHAIVLDSSRHS